MSNFTYNGKNVYYEEISKGIPLFLLHGNTASSNMFSIIKNAYAKDFKVILIDFLGHGRSDRIDKFPDNMWEDQGKQVISLIKQNGYKNACLIGTSGGAIAALNAAIEAPLLISKVIADSFEGEIPLASVTQNIAEQRLLSKKDESAVAFYESMHGDDWEKIVDCDTQAIINHADKIGHFFNKDLSTITADVLLTASKGDEFLCCDGCDYIKKAYCAMKEKIKHGSMYMFNEGTHPAMMSNFEEFYKISKDFLTNN